MHERPNNNDEEQDWLIAHLEAQGYQPNPEGVCFGVAHMGIQAFLARDIDTFSKRARLLQEIQPDALIDAIEKTRVKSAKQGILSRQEELILSVPAFFDGVDIYCRINSLKELLEKHESGSGKFLSAVTASTLASPIQLEETPLELDKPKIMGMAQAAAFGGAYTLDELMLYFKSLNTELLDDPSLINPFCIAIGSINHSIAVGYDPQTKMWTYIDANYLPPISSASYEDMAAMIFKNFFGPEVGMVVLKSEIYVANIHDEELKKSGKIERWKRSTDWEKIHEITSDKVNRLDLFRGNWLHMATEIEDVEIVKKMLAVGARDIKSANAYTALIIAVNNKNIELVNLLLTGVEPNVNAQNDMGLTALAIACFKGETDIVRALLKHKEVDPTLVSEFGDFALELAILRGHNDIVQLLLQDKRIDVNQLHNGRHLASLAALIGNMDALMMLLQHDDIVKQNYPTLLLTLTAKENKGGTSEQLAKIKEAKECIQFFAERESIVKQDVKSSESGLSFWIPKVLPEQTQVEKNEPPKKSNT